MYFSIKTIIRFMFGTIFLLESTPQCKLNHGVYFKFEQIHGTKSKHQIVLGDLLLDRNKIRGPKSCDTTSLRFFVYQRSKKSVFLGK